MRFAQGAKKKGMKLNKSRDINKAECQLEVMGKSSNYAAATGYGEREEPPVPTDGGTQSGSGEETDSKEKFPGG